MSYDFMPKNDVEEFRMGAFSWPILLEVFGYLFPFQSKGGRWVYNWEIDNRFKEEHNYPIIISNDGFEVTEEEARMMARMTRNYCAIQRKLDDSHFNEDVPVTAPEWERKWPQKIREDWIEKFKEFADWAETSGGFKIY